MLLIGLTLALALAQDTVRPPTIGVAVLRRVDSIVAAEFAKDSLGSITVGVVSGAGLVWTRSHGFTDRTRTRLATAGTVYRVASITKQLTAIMLLQLVQQHRVAFADPVERHYPAIRSVRSLPTHATSPTLVQLATMTSGLSRDPDDARRSQTGAPAGWEATMLGALPSTQFAASPGTIYRYSNIGYAILGAALAHAAAEPYTAYVERRILRPLGMHASGFTLTPALSAALAAGVDYDELHRDTLNYADAAFEHVHGLGYRLPGGGLYSTVGDLAKLVALQLGYGPDTVLSSSALQARSAVPVAATAALDYGYGLGFQTYRWGDTTAVGHSGNLAGYTAQVLYDPVRKFGVIVLRSAAGGQASAGRLAGSAFRTLRGSLGK